MIKILLTQRDGQGGEKMLENALKSVKEAEEKAAAVMREADAQAAAIIEEAKAKANLK